MKTYLILLTFLCTWTVVYGQTNVYHPFPHSIAVWKGTCAFTGDPPPFQYSRSQYSVNGSDTIIGAIKYKKIFDGAFHYFTAFRQDIRNKKVYALCSNCTASNKEYLLYDFALAVGDTFKARPLVECDSISIVESIDSVLVGGKYRKKLNLASKSTRHPISVIEGIGSLDGLFEQSCFERACKLCSFQDSSGMYDTGNSYCYLGVKTIGQRPTFYIYPNPFSCQTIINMGNSYTNLTMIVYDILGQVVKRIDNISSQTIIFYRDNLISGLYFIRLTHNNTVIVTDKLVILDN